MSKIDLNADLGEGYGPYRMADDEAMLEIVSSASIACGFHAGDPEVMYRALRLARKHNVAAGAHPGYQDIAHFGRREIPHTHAEIERLVAYQLGAIEAMARLAGHRITYVKPHGALGNLADADREVANAIARAIRAVNPSFGLVATALGELVPAGNDHGLEVFHEIFADRAYDDRGLLVDRRVKGAVIEDAGHAAQRVMEMMEAGAIITVSGRRLTTPIDTVCVHGDTPQAVAMARTIRTSLTARGFVLAPFAP